MLPRNFLKDESGAGTTLSLFLFVCLVCILGIMVDATNGWRNRTYLMSSADMGAHAGATGIARGMTQAQIKDEVERVVEANLPVNMFGNVIDTTTDVSFAFWDHRTETFITSTDFNTVVVDIQRTSSRGNPVATLMSQFSGTESFNVRGGSAATYTRSGRCSSTDGIFAIDEVRISSQATVGPGICIHSEDSVWLPQQNTFLPGSMVTMPDLEDCKSKCVDSANPGIVAREANMIFPDIPQFILDTYDDFASSGLTNPVKAEFFNNSISGPTAADIALLRTNGVLGASDPDPVKGDVLVIDYNDFTAMPYLPQGLVYNIQCNPKGNGQKTILDFSGSQGVMNDAALITNCSLMFENGSEVIGSVLITTRNISTATIGSDSSVIVSDPAQGCNSDDRTVIMGMANVQVPAEFAMSNLTLIVDGNVNIASATSSGIYSQGFAVYATGEVDISSQHQFYTCDQDNDFLVPYGQVVRILMPPKA